MANGKGYVVFQVTVNNPEGYQAYAAADHVSIIEQFGGKIAAVDDDVKHLEGNWPHKRTVILEFPSVQQAHNWYISPEYQELAALRHAAATSEAAIVAGLS